jgi:oligopeptide/dipeptide ABC transporter ATP-binding protein
MTETQARMGDSVQDSQPALQIEGLVKEFRVGGGASGHAGVVRAVAGVSFSLGAGETLGLVGESGSGKTTLGRVLVGLEEPTAGTGQLWGKPLFKGGGSRRREVRRVMQMVFQDPYGSLDPRMTLYQLISEPWLVHHGVVPRGQRRSRVQDLMLRVGLDPAALDKTAREFSGGQRQRIGIARALALNPRILILDEPVSALDVSIQAQIIELLRQLQETLGLSMIFIAHNLAVVRSIAHRVAVMYMGRIVEIGDADAIFAAPRHPYTKALLSAVPSMKSKRAERIVLTGEVPSPLAPPPGCPFHTRCWRALAECAAEVPTLMPSMSGRTAVACFSPIDVSAHGQDDQALASTPDGP